MSFLKKLLLLVSVATAILNIDSQQLAINGDRSAPHLQRIIGGRPANTGQFPYQVSLRNSYLKQHFCGGSIISSLWFLTAAHCVQRQTYDFTVIVGSTFINGSGVEYNVIQIISNKEYNEETALADIAVLRSETSIMFNSLVQPIPLASVKPLDHSNGVLTGWGYTKKPYSLYGPNNLQYIHLVTIPLNECRAALPSNNINDGNICTLTNKGEGACLGDSGGPLAKDSLQIGIVSYGIPCAIGKPDVYTSVAHYRQWILEKTGV